MSPIEKNVLIAEFLQWPKTTHNGITYYGIPDWIAKQELNNEFTVVSVVVGDKWYSGWPSYELAFDKSMNWLFEAFMAVKPLGYEFEINEFPSIRKSSLANLHVRPFDKWQFKGDSPVEKAWNLISEFINFYNNK